MTTLDHDAAAATDRRLRSQEEVEAHIRAICFKTGPPARIGAELEWTLHHAAAPDAPLDAATVRHALGRHAPAVLEPRNDPPDPLPGGSRLTMEPGGQLEISSAPAASLAELHTDVSAGLGHLTALIAAAGLALGEHGIDPHRPPRRLLSTPRYTAMERVFDARGRDGRTMMCSTAGLQVCLDAGPAGEVPLRWQAVHAAGPPLIALFANSRRHAGRNTGLASARMAAWWAMDRRLTHPPVGPPGDPVTAWARYALAAPLLCVRRDGECWDPPPGLTLCDWVHGALPSAPTTDDVEYHLSTLFPPVRPRGYLEVRYLDCQPGADWIAPVAVVAALLADRPAAEAVLDVTAPVTGRWAEAYRLGLAHRPLRGAAEALADMALRRLDPALPGAVREHVIATVHRRLRDATTAEEPR